MILPIKKYPKDGVLRIPGAEVAFPLSSENAKLVNDMVATVREANGIGLAAPQVGKSLRIIIVNLEHLDVPTFALINPEIKKASKVKTDMEEGCLSIPGIFGIVERSARIEFRARDLNGDPVSGECSGLLARVIQHEIDHIDGVLIVDKFKKVTKTKKPSAQKAKENL